MKLTVLLLTIAVFSAHGNSMAQNLTISGKGLTLKEVFTTIEKQSGYVIIANEGIFNGTRTVSLDVTNMPLREVLDLVLKAQLLHYSIHGKTIFLSRKAAYPPALPTDGGLKIASLIIQPDPQPVTGTIVDSLGRPLQGVSVQLDPGNRGGTTNKEGVFSIGKVPPGNYTIEITFVNHLPIVRKITVGNSPLELGNLVMKINPGDMKEIVVINTGYQKLKPNELAGAADVITKKMLMEQTGTNILERLNGMTGSLNFNNKVLPGNATGNPNSVLNMTIRGYSTINGTTDPLIILNNFPYTGDINNIDPNDVESIVILKDAAATAMWGIRAANGVIVITTSGSKFGQKTRVNYRYTISATPEPDLSKVDVADGPEVYDFIAEHMGKSLPSILQDYQAIPELDFTGWQYYKGHISEAEFNEKMERLKAIHPRQQWADLLYKTGISQTHSLNVSGGSETLTWVLAVNREDRSGTLQEKSNRNNIRMTTGFKMSDKLRLELGIAYTKSYNKTGAPAYNSLKDGNNYMSTRGLQNPDGTPYGFYINYSPVRMDTVGAGLLGDLKFYPLTDWKQNYTTTTLENYTKNFRLVYTPLKDLELAVSLQSVNQTSAALNRAEKESYYARYNVAYFANIDYARRIVNYQLPKGEIHRIRNNYSNSFNGRVDLNYKKKIGKGLLVFNGAFDISESVNKADGEFLVGYEDNPRKYTYPHQQPVYSSLVGGTVYPIYSTDILTPKEVTQRNISTTASLAYIYDERLVFNVNGRRDGANILGVNVNERWKPNFSAGLNWRLHKEKFFNIDAVSNLTVGISSGFVGNVDVSKSSRLVATSFGYHSTFTELPGYYQTAIPPNPELRWEKTSHTNFKLDIGLFNDRIQLFSNIFLKNVRDLYLSTTVDPIQALATQYIANAGKMNVRGYELSLMAKIIDSKSFGYDITFSTARTKESVKYYPNTYTHGENLRMMLQNDGVALTSLPALFSNMPLFSIISFDGKMGVNNKGEYEVEYDGQVFNNGIELLSYVVKNGKDFTGIKNYGTGTPTFTGAFHNRFRYRNWSLLVSLQAELGHYFKYPTDNVNFLTLSNAFYRRWQKPGDEAHTELPEYTIPENKSWFSYRMYSRENIMKGGVIRINNIQLNYTIPTRKLKVLNLAFNAQNLGKIWTANGKGYDYRNLNFMSWNSEEKYYAFTVNVGF
ncbi:SusC/RagA family TonB-linked outer membrane protein [Pseudobacter ginsenosidimutans]|nr:SusC/RagA family TonB-linked outer membrane protein [Pseudobacter ginsenosidimutans]